MNKPTSKITPILEITYMGLVLKRRKLKIPFTILQTDSGIMPYCGAPLGKHQLKVVVKESKGKIIGREFLSAESPFAKFAVEKDEKRYTIQVQPRKLLHRIFSQPLVFETNSKLPEPLRVLIVGTGRCGSKSVAKYLNNLNFRDGTPVSAKHETLAYPLLTAVINKNHQAFKEIVTSYSHNLEVGTGYFALVPEAIKAKTKVLLIRDGRDVVSSGLSRGWFTRDSLWDRVKPDFAGDIFEKCCHLWTKCNERLEQYTDITIRLEDLIQDSNARVNLLKRLDIAHVERSFPQLNSSKNSETRHQPWTSNQNETFARVCGHLMDRHYPNWRNN